MEVHLKKEKYYHSFYAEIADMTERFFYDVDILEKPDDFIPQTKTNVVSHSSNSTSTKKSQNREMTLLKFV